MKFNYKDKTPKLDSDNKEEILTNDNKLENKSDNITNEETSHVTEEVTPTISDEIKLDMPSFEDFMHSEENTTTPNMDSFSTPEINFDEKTFNVDTETPKISVGVSMDDLPEPDPEPTLPDEAIHGETTFEVNPIFEPIPDDIKNDKPEIESIDFETKEIEENFNENTTIPDDFIDFTDLEPSIQEETKVDNSSDLNIDEVFDASTIKPKKEKKSIFGNKKDKEPIEKQPKESKPKKEKKSIFGKKSKKAEMLDRLDEISQTETTDNTVGSDLLVGFGLAEPKEEQIEENKEQVLKESSIFEDTNFDKQENLNNNDTIMEANKQNEDNDIPSVLFENEIGFFPTEEQTSEETQNSENNIPSIFSENTESTNIPPQIDTSVDIPSTNPNSLFDTPTSNNETNLEPDISNDLNIPVKKKKKISPVVWIVSAIVIIAIILCILATKMLFSKNEPANQIPQTTPVVEQNINIDTETVEGLVEETQQIVDNANEVADTYQENNELPPQVGIDIDEEINAENEEETPAIKVFTDGKVSFSYPSEWAEISSFNTRETADNVSNVVMLGITQLDIEDTNNMRVTVEKTLTSITAKDYLDKTAELMKNSFKNIKTRKSAELTIAGREAPSRIYTFEDESGNEVEQFQIYVANGQDMYVITFTSSVESFAKNLDTYKEILKTLQIN